MVFIFWAVIFFFGVLSRNRAYSPSIGMNTDERNSNYVYLWSLRCAYYLCVYFDICWLLRLDCSFFHSVCVCCCRRRRRHRRLITVIAYVRLNGSGKRDKKCSSQKCVTEVIQQSSKKLLNHCFGVRNFHFKRKKREKRNAIFPSFPIIAFGWTVLHTKTNASTLNEYLFISPLSLSLPSSLSFSFLFFVSSILNYLCDIFKAISLRIRCGGNS